MSPRFSPFEDCVRRLYIFTSAQRVQSLKEAELDSNKTISAEEGALRRGQQAVSEAKEGIDLRTKQVRGDIETLRGYWRGAAATSFTQLMQRWDAETVKLNNILVELENSLRGTEQDQAATEEEQKSAISGLTAMMGGN